MDEETETTPTEKPAEIQLPLALWRYLDALEKPKNAKLAEAERIHAEAVALEQLQQTRVTGFFEGAGLGDFDPDEWEILAGGLMKRLIAPAMPLLAAVPDEQPEAPVDEPPTDTS
jgi:hypothetical protein